MIHVSNDPIPAHKLGQFHEVLCACGGRYRGNPRDCTKQEGVYRVDYSYDPTTGFDERWRRCIEDVREVRKDQWWRRMLRRLANNAVCGPKPSAGLGTQDGLVGETIQEDNK